MSRRGDKKRDMARSILPCRNRKAARQEKARVHRKARRVVRESIHTDPDEVEQHELRTRIETSQAMWWRRDGDKINHFCRWGRSRTGHLPPGDRVAALRGELDSSGLIAEHALGHFAREVEVSHLHDRRRRAARFREAREARLLAENRPVPSERALRKLLREAFVTAHAELNAVLKTLALAPCDARSPCKSDPRVSTACSGTPVLRVPADVLCIARRLWRDGARAQKDASPSGDVRVAALFGLGPAAGR
jgi:hypothetical protein